jgi:hypothetical protein
MLQPLIQQYVNNFRRRFSRFLKPGVGMGCRVLMTDHSGAIVEFAMGSDLANTDRYEPVSHSMALALGQIQQRAFVGNLDGYVFKGTNTILEPNRIIFIKEENPSEWSDSAAERDVSQVLNSRRGAKT